jgi:rhamnosyl/mannosyltransferase
MRVLHVGKYYPPFAGGMEYFLADLLPALQEQGVQVAALVHHHRRSLFGQKPASISLGPLIYRAPCYGQLLYAPISPSFPFWLASVLRQFKPDLLHLHLPNTSAFWVLFIPAAQRLPWVIHWHSDVVPSQFDRRLALAYAAYRPLERRLLAASRAIIATSPPYQAYSPTLRPWKDKCQIIPLGLNPERLAEPPLSMVQEVQHCWGNRSYKLLAVGRLTYYKGHEVLIRAVARLPDTRLLIVGEGERRVRLEILIKTLKLEAKVRLMGLLSEAELHALLATGDVFCLSSLERTEAFGLVLLEAMRFQKPVVASDITGSGVGWVVQQGGHGLLVKPNDVEALSKALLQLRQAPQQRSRLGQSGARSLRTTFHINQIAQQTIALYRQVLRAPR